MSAQLEKQCTHLVFNIDEPRSLKEILNSLEKGSDLEKYDAMNEVIQLHQQGEGHSNKVLMTVIRYVEPTEYKPLKKLLLYYWEVVDKKDKSGKLLPEMYLICNFLRKDLSHFNEYVRGATLRFICKLHEPELLEPLIQPIIENLTHRHSYVKRNAVLAIYSIYQRFEHLIPDAPEFIEEILNTEPDSTSKRNAFIMLVNCDQERAVKYVRENINSFSSAGDTFQLSLLNLLRKMCKSYPNEKSKYLRVISSLLDSKSPAVLYQCAGTLISLSSASVAIKAAANCYVQLLLTNGDSNVKLIVLDRIVDLKNRYPDVMQSILMDLLRALSSPSMQIKKKVLETSLGLVTQKNIDDFISCLKKELLKTDIIEDSQVTSEYKKILIHSLHELTLKYPEISPNTLFAIDFIGDSCGYEAASFARDISQTHSKLKNIILQKICDDFTSIKSPKVFRVIFWILGTQSETKEEIELVFDTIKDSLIDIISIKKDEENDENYKNSTQPKLNSDGTYAHETFIKEANESIEKVITLKSLIENGNSFLVSVLSSTLTKIGLRSIELKMSSNFVVDSILLIIGLIKLANSKNISIEKDTLERISLFIKLLTNNDEISSNILLNDTKDKLDEILKIKEKTRKEIEFVEAKEKSLNQQVDSGLNITQLKGRKFDIYEFEEEDVLLATSNVEKNSGMSKLNKVSQLTGFSDTVYAETTVTVHQFDILLDILIVNQTNDTLQNLNIELATIGDLKLVERPHPQTLGGFEQRRINTSIKVSSTESGLIFGNIIYDVASESKCVVLNEIRIDIMDYILPSICTDTEFRTMWFEFDWENKIVISTENFELKEYLDIVSNMTNMKCLTSDDALVEDCGFLSANLYAKSSFGEDALANLSLEKNGEKLTGFFRIRSKAQGIAAALGDKIHKFQQQKK
eukprot:gene4160-7470_t